MARIRTIKPEMFQDEKLAPCDPTTRLVFIGLIAMADDAGRVLDNVRVIDAFIFPETHDSSHEALMRLSGMGRVVRGKTASGQRVVQIANWEAHQKIQHPNLRSALPEIVEIQEVATSHEPLMNDSRGAHEPLTHHTYDQRPVPTTSTNDQPLADVAVAPIGRSGGRKAARASAPRRFPGFLAETCNAAYDLWLERAGAVDYGQFRKAFGPAFAKPEADRPPALPRDEELIPIVRLYLAAIRGTSGAKFVRPEACAKAVTQLAVAVRTGDTPERRLMLAQHALGLTDEVRRLAKVSA